MRTTMVKPEFWSDEITGELVRPDDPALFYIGLWQMCDDAGWLRWNAKEAAAQLYPFLAPKDRLDAVIANMTVLVQAKRVRLFKCGHAQLPTFGRHQRYTASYRKSYRYREEHLREPRRTAANRGEPRSPAESRVLGSTPLHSAPSHPNARSRANGADPELVAEHVRFAASPDKAVARAGSRWLAERGYNEKGELSVG